MMLHNPERRAWQGGYTGDGAASHAITGIPFRPIALIIVERGTNGVLGFKTTNDGTSACVIDPTAATMDYSTERIISLDTNGFTVKDPPATCNKAGEIYSFMAWG